MMVNRIRLAWAYISELLLSFLALYAVGNSFGWLKIHQWTIQIASDFATFVLIVLLAGALTIICTVYSKSDTPFLIWLERKGHLKCYTSAFNYCALVFLASTIVSMLAQRAETPLASYTCAFLFFLSTINAYTMLMNLAGIFKLNMTFNAKRAP